MNHDQKFPVEPLSPESWRRIEQRLFSPAAVAERAAATSAQVRPRPRRVLFVTAGVLAVFAVLAWRGLMIHDAPITTRQLVASEDTVETELGDAVVQLEAGASALLHDEGARGALVVLQRGEARFSVPPRGARAPFAVQAGAVRVEVVGTRFRVQRVGERVRVSDEEGRVRVNFGGQSTLLRPGMRWDSDEAAGARLQGTHPAPEVNPLAPTATDAQHGATIDAQGEPPASAVRRANQPTEEQLRARFERAARLEASDTAAALRGYGALATGRGPWAEAALFAMGRLAFEQGDRIRAAPLLHSYLRKYPRGENAADVRVLLARLREAGDEGAR